MKTIEFLKEVHHVNEVWFYFEDEETKSILEHELGVNLDMCQTTARFDSTFNEWMEVSPKLKSIYRQCGARNLFGGIVFVDYKNYIRNQVYII